MSEHEQAEFDVVVFGATGYTGRLVAEYLATAYPHGGQLSWALAGRSLERLTEVADATGASAETGLVVADASDPDSLRAMLHRTRAVITTAGPYRLHGSELLAACADTGTDYLDLCGEPEWMRQMIDEHEERARRSGARILFSCGFDSVPSELGVWFCQEVALQRLGSVVPHVKGRIREFVGGISGGSVATRDAAIAAATNEPSLAQLLADPFCLTPGFTGPDQPTASTTAEDPDIGPVWPFMLGPTNSKNVHRSNFLLGHPYGTDFLYDEMRVGTPTALPTERPAAELPRPGEGPSRADLEAGSLDMVFIGRATDGRQVRASVTCDQDPGYGSSARMIVESAVSLLAADGVAGGIWTPAAALGQDLLDRLEARAGMTFVDESA